MSWIASLSFGAPWLLIALAVLPAIYFLLRVTPPSPRRVAFPPLRLLLGWRASEETPARTPLWLLALRLIAAAAVIAALADPTIGERQAIEGKGPLVLFVDNGWTAAHAWDKRQAVIGDALRAAARDNRGVALIATAQMPSLTLLDAGEAARRAGELEPQPWPADRSRAAAAIARTKFASTPEILWLSDGIDDGHGHETAEALSKAGDLKTFADDPGNGPLALLPPKNETDGFAVTILRADHDGTRTGSVAALGAQGEMLATAPFRIEDGKDKAGAKIRLPLEVRNTTSRVVIVDNDSAGSVQLLDAGAARRAIGLVSASNVENEQPLLSDLYYLERALAPYADVQKGTISELLARNVAILVLADVGKIAGADHDKVARFVADGGLLIRFAGGRMTNESDDLVPVKLRTGGRYLGGTLAWAEPQHLAPFPEASPFAGLSIPQDVVVSRQILAEPSVELSDRSWARLADGTPLVTGVQRGKGWIVLFHITANPSWSTLPLSGLYVDMLRRLTVLSTGARPGEMTNATALPAAQTLDGFGRPHRPPPDALPIRVSEIARTVVSRAHPPGLYGASGAELALNAVKTDTVLQPLAPFGQMKSYGHARVIALQTPLLILAVLLLLADGLIALGLRGYLRSPRAMIARGGALLLAAAIAWHAQEARADDAFDLKAALSTRLAYVVTGLPDLDATSRAGLLGLTEALKERTSYEPDEPLGVNVERDDLSFFPLLYWPMDPREKDLSPEAVSKIGDYMRNGGTIVFDTRDLSLGAVRGPQSPGEQTLRRLLAKLDIPPLQPVPSDHVLTKAFYLLQDFPGRWDGGKVWVEALPPADPNEGPAPARGGDGVSPVVIGSNDWAAAWAVDSQGRPLVDVVPGGERQREMAIRFGINLVMYAFTGNYKTDQVHVPALLERLGR